MRLHIIFVALLLQRITCAPLHYFNKMQNAMAMLILSYKTQQRNAHRNHSHFPRVNLSLRKLSYHSDLAFGEGCAPAIGRKSTRVGVAVPEKAIFLRHCEIKKRWFLVDQRHGYGGIGFCPPSNPCRPRKTRRVKHFLSRVSVFPGPKTTAPSPRRFLAHVRPNKTVDSPPRPPRTIVVTTMNNRGMAARGSRSGTNRTALSTSAPSTR